MLEYEVEIKEGAEVTLDGDKVTFKGAKGELSREFSHPKIKVEKKDAKIVIKSEDEGKRVKSMMGTWRAHMNNMITGVTKGWTCSLKLVYAHFPVKLEQKDRHLLIKNFIGARSDRTADVLEGVEMKLEGDTIKLSGADKEKVGQSAANIEHATKVRGYDRRIFQDGIYLSGKPVPMEGE
ncbi:MAG: 50S ribosomal protein L6 [Candidatus Aenigmatarchaeota archaeon]|nr:MAG: 50S ribosomal protein L6 [Candidatus Aenigmarchaeota archaeon]